MIRMKEFYFQNSLLQNFMLTTVLLPDDLHLSEDLSL